MKLIFKIAIGVFLGVIAVVIAITLSLPAGIQKSKEGKEDRKAFQTMRHLTPESLVQNCGKPGRDLIDKAINERYLYYPDHRVTVAFFRDGEGQWTFTGMFLGNAPKVDHGIVITDPERVTDDPGKVNASSKQVAHLPCVAKN